MQNVILIVHLIVALCLIGIVLLQRSEGGGLGMGGGGGGLVSARGAASALGKLTWGFAIAFIVTSITLTILAARDDAASSIFDRVDVNGTDSGSETGLPSGESLLPPAPTAPDDTVPRAD